MDEMDEFAIMMGFEDAKEMNRLVASVDLSTPTRQTAFQHWKEVDGTIEGLLKVIEGSYLHYRYEEQP